MLAKQWLFGMSGVFPLEMVRRIVRSLLGLLAAVALTAGLVLILRFFQQNHWLTLPYTMALAFLVGAGCILVGSQLWMVRIENHRLLRSDEKLQNKDALVIATFSLLALHLGLCVTSAAAGLLFPTRGMAASLLAQNAALAANAVGGIFGFLLGHPRRLAEEGVNKDGRTGSSWLLRTGLDDIVDWLVKGITTVLLVQAKPILNHLWPLAKSVGAGIAGTSENDLPAGAYIFGLSIILYFTLFGVGATCLVTRTYLTGALGRADRSSVNAFSRVGLDWGEVLTLAGVQRSLGTRGGEWSAEVRTIADKLAALSLIELRTPREYALWAKANSALGRSAEAIHGYEKAILECDCDPALLLDYAVALSGAGDRTSAVNRLEQARRQLSEVTPDEVRKNIYKSLTFALLYLPNRYDRVLALIDKYLEFSTETGGGLRVNQACAYGQKFRDDARAASLLQTRADQILCVVPPDPGSEAWLEPMKTSYQGALDAIKIALKYDPDWKHRLIELLVRSIPGKDSGDNDLEVFEAFPDFRNLLGLPPLASAPSKPVSQPTDGTPDKSKEGQSTEPPENAVQSAAVSPSLPAATPGTTVSSTSAAVEGILPEEVKQPPSQSITPPASSSSQGTSGESGETHG